MDKRSRAIRRHHRARVLMRTYKMQLSQVYRFKTDETPDRCMTFARKRFNNRQMCSCWICGNPRKYKAGSRTTYLTMQEVRADSRFKYEMMEVE